MTREQIKEMLDAYLKAEWKYCRGRVLHLTGSQ